MYVCMYVCIRSSTGYVDACVYQDRMHICVCVCIYIYMYIDIHLHTCKCKRHVGYCTLWA